MHTIGPLCRRLLFAVCLSAAASCCASPASSPPETAMRSLGDTGLSILLRMGFSGRIKTCHGKYLSCGGVGSMGVASAEDEASATIFWIQEVSKDRPGECVLAADLKASLKAGASASFMAMTGNGDEGHAMSVTGNQSSSVVSVAWSKNPPLVSFQEAHGGPSQRYLCAHRSGKLGLKEVARNFERFELSACNSSIHLAAPSSGAGEWIGAWEACVSAAASLGVEVSMRCRNAKDHVVTLKPNGSLFVGGEETFQGVELHAGPEFGKVCLVDTATGRFLLVDKRGKCSLDLKPGGGGDMYEAEVRGDVLDRQLDLAVSGQRRKVLWPKPAGAAKPTVKGKGGGGAASVAAAASAAEILKGMSLNDVNAVNAGGEGKGGRPGGSRGGKEKFRKGMGGGGQKNGGKPKRLTYDQKVKQGLDNFVVKGQKAKGGAKDENKKPGPPAPAPAAAKKENPLSKLPDPKDAKHSGNDGESSLASGMGGASSVSSAGAVKCDGCMRPLASTKMAGGQTKYTYRDHEGRKLCDACFTNVAPRCARCNMAVTGTITTALKKSWHPECLKCENCKAQLQATFYLVDHKPNVPFCSFCIKGIEQSEQAARDRRRGGLQQQGAGVPGSMFAMGGAAGIVGGGGIMSPAGGFGGSLPQGGGGSTPVFGKLGKRLD